MAVTASAGAGPAATSGCLCHPLQAHSKPAPFQLEWIKSFETGSAEIDALHRELVQECNSLLQSVESDAAWSRIIADASRLVEGCVQHFRYEEKLLEGVRFPRTAEHVAEHRRVERELQSLVLRMKMVDGSCDEHRAYPRALGPILVDFIIRHDLDYRSHLLHQQGC